MIGCIQRVRRAAVTVDERVVGEIGVGLLVLLGVGHHDDEREAKRLADKIIHLRIFEDEAGKMNRSVQDVGGSLLVVSQFTLLGDCRKGRRPSFTDAAPPEEANRLYEYFVQLICNASIPVQTGIFHAMMQIELVNDGPTTFWIDSQTIGKG
ncbi:MAG: D-aminoacyl-tRNA deacylase [Thermoguttaceae bacterium]|nr:D-aminoacyl-tRNA deacylase [Thermoguttaceae bacterium]